MNENISVEKCLELTSSITLEVIKSGKLDSSNAQAVADYLQVVYLGVAALASLDKTDVEKFVRNIGTKRIEVTPAL